MPHRQAIIIFVKNPELGKVKTRLAETIGAEKALGVYKRLLVLTHRAVVSLPFRKFVFYDNYIEENDLWGSQFFQKEVQQGRDLGERMRNAFELVLGEPQIERAVIIGSDCPDINPNLITKALVALESHDVVLGPATDGGYYLLGLKEVIPEVFEGKDWSTPQLLHQTTDALFALDKTCYLLPALSDVDHEADLALLPPL